MKKKKKKKEDEEEKKRRELAMVVVTVRWNHIHKSCEGTARREFHVGWIRPVNATISLLFYTS